ncbi:rRNA maturation RNase YbeY [Dermabacter sp. p3-SID358]|uniref:rRNA maturation RNase YbeY n=1 Tax=Dermabacter sp. p3-SID358 TaxID=2916114 RepID=UPI0021A87E0E|nr:rRNA maturation RNase YbeY [Dermabacter sp. p3-SID358]MCT1865979.1 rRNA maturation RNase YbeY [Dermabacter sp. p3-SID358]
MSIDVNNETTAKIDAREFVDLARYVFDAMFLHPATELSITFVDEAAMSDLHKEWMDLEGPTDVMSFPMDELREGREGELAPEGLLGDIVMCPIVAAQQARIAGHSAEEEMLLLLTHGILHLLGYDHVEPEEERVMFTLQRKLLLTFLANRGSHVGISDTGGSRA